MYVRGTICTNGITYGAATSGIRSTEKRRVDVLLDEVFKRYGRHLIFRMNRVRMEEVRRRAGIESELADIGIREH